MTEGKRLNIYSIVVGPLATNCYIIESAGEAIVIDPGGEPEKIIETLKSLSLKVKMIINTHGHIDHISANNDIIGFTSAPLAIHPDDLSFLTYDWEKETAELGIRVNSPREADIYLTDGDKVKIGNVEFNVIHTPGHSPGCICLHTEKTLICGDTLFYEGVGRWDLPRGDYETLINSIRTKIYTLPDDTDVYPGHGPSTSISHEKKHNPFIRA
ncbi:MAG TPA: MBL fold metallo-hydrolase [Firmicutes bacterium]|nr:MBL fold metallo-hydrolase [Bacillota bacterium]